MCLSQRSIEYASKALRNDTSRNLRNINRLKKYDYAILQNPTSLINANILGVYLEHIVKKTGNTRIGLETGFLLPFVLTGSFFNIYNQKQDRTGDF